MTYRTGLLEIVQEIDTDVQRINFLIDLAEQQFQVHVKLQGMLVEKQNHINELEKK